MLLTNIHQSSLWSSDTQHRQGSAAHWPCILPWSLVQVLAKVQSRYQLAHQSHQHAPLALSFLVGVPREALCLAILDWAPSQAVAVWEALDARLELIEQRLDALPGRKILLGPDVPVKVQDAERSAAS